jgi:hypothetical protein
MFGMIDPNAGSKHGGLEHHNSDHVSCASAEFNPASPTEKMYRRNSHASMSTASASHSGNFQSQTHLSPTKAEKKIIELANELAPDLQVSVLTEIDFSNRKINLGEKEMLLKGLRVEAEGELESAISCYTRAGMHSKDPHISKMLIGNLHYKSGKIMLALNFYTQAAQMLTSRSGSTRLVTDEFIT